MAAKQVAANCIIGAGSIFHGRLAVNGSLHIEGKFQGDIFTDGDVVVGPTGQAKTDITTRKVVVAGTFIGNIRASEEVYVMQSGKVLGSITTPSSPWSRGWSPAATSRLPPISPMTWSIR